MSTLCYSVTMEELEDKLKETTEELTKLKQEIKSLGQQLAASMPRAQALAARKELEGRIDDLTK